MSSSESEELRALRQRCERQGREIAQLNEVLHRKNVELDALHMVWCDGGCVGGVHRWTDGPVTEEVVASAERSVTRLRRWFDHARFRLDRHPRVSEWEREYATRLSAKVGE